MEESINSMQNFIENNLDKFLVLKKFEEIAPIPRNDKGIFYNCMAFCLENDYKLDELLNLYKMGLAAGEDFYDLALLTHQAVITKIQKQMATAPEQSTDDPLNPGKPEVRTAGRIAEKLLIDLKKMHDEEKLKIPLRALLGPSFDQLPSYILEMMNSGMNYEEVFSMV